MLNTKTVVTVTAVIVVVALGYWWSSSKTASLVKDKSDATALKIGYLPLIDHMTLMVAKGADLFDGINVEPVKFSDWPSLVEAMSSGKLDGVHVINNVAVKMVLNGLDAQTVVLSHREAIDFVVANDIANVNDLRGKTIAVPSRFSPHYMMLEHFMKQNGLVADKDYKVLEVAPPDFVSTLASGKISGFVGSEPFPTIAKSKDIGKIFKVAKDMMIDGSNGLDCVVVFRSDLIKNNPAAVQAYVDGIVKAGEMIKNDPTESSRVASPFLLNQKSELIMDALTRSRFDDLMPRVSEYEALQNFAVQIGVLPSKIDLTKFVNTTFAKLAYQKIGLNMQ